LALSCPVLVSSRGGDILIPWWLGGQRSTGDT